MTSTVYLEQTTRPVYIILKGWKLIIRDLVCASIFAYANCLFSHNAAQIGILCCPIYPVCCLYWDFIVPIIVPIYHLKAESQLNAS